PEHCGTLRKEGATVIFAGGELYCLAVIFGYAQVVLSFGQFMGEYNITKAARLSYNLTAGQISLQTFSLQYHFSCRE
ncbi:MAG: hypothetical protein IKM53_01555, partial [Clostridia bacterium]|nr:hypothetical protein [Clostridia bacterium]